VGSLQVVYSTPSAAAVSDFVSKHYHLPNSIECKLLYRGWNDIFEVRTNDDARFIFRISKRRARGDADVASETAFLAYLDEAGIPVAAAIPMRNGSLFTSTFFPEGLRPAVLFRYAEGRPSQARSSTADARVNGVTLARIHDAANGFDASDRGRYRLDRDHLLHRPLSTILAIDDLSDSVGTGLVNLTGRLCVRWQNGTDFPGHAATVIATGITRTLRCKDPERDKRCSSISTIGGPGYLAYDLAAFLHSCVSFGRKDHAFWHAFIEGYRTICKLPHVDFEAVHLFVPIRHMWLVGEYASHIDEWGRQAVPADWIAAQLDFMLSWEKEKLAPGLL